MGTNPTHWQVADIVTVVKQAPLTPASLLQLLDPPTARWGFPSRTSRSTPCLEWAHPGRGPVVTARVVHSHSRSAITQIVVTIVMYIGRLHTLFGQPITQMAFTFVYCLGRGRRVHGSNTQIAFTFVYWFGTGGACTQGGGLPFVYLAWVDSSPRRTR